MNRLPKTDMQHGLRVALFALSCLLEEIRPQRKRTP